MRLGPILAIHSLLLPLREPPEEIKYAEAFARDLRERLLAIHDGNFEESVCFTYDLAIKPAPHT